MSRSMVQELLEYRSTEVTGARDINYIFP